MKITKKDNKYTIEAGRREYLLLLKAVDFGATWMDENGYAFCKISDLEEDPATMAIGQYEHRGVSVHPSDLGMELIAKRIFDVI